MDFIKTVFTDRIL